MSITFKMGVQERNFLLMYTGFLTRYYLNGLPNYAHYRINTHYIYVDGYQTTHFVGISCELNQIVRSVFHSSYTGDRRVVQFLCGAIQRNRVAVPFQQSENWTLWLYTLQTSNFNVKVGAGFRL